MPCVAVIRVYCKKKVVMQENLNIMAKAEFIPPEHETNESFSVRADVCRPALRADCW